MSGWKMVIMLVAAGAEYFIHKNLMTVISPLISSLQYGVLPKKSTSHYLTKMLDFLLKSLDKKSSPAILTLLDCQKAFDMVDHNIIIDQIAFGTEKSCQPSSP